MSWSISVCGSPEKVAEAVKKYSEQVSGNCKVEYDAAMPHILGMVEQNYTKPGLSYKPKFIRLNANGSGSTYNNIEVQRSCHVTIDTMPYDFVG